MTTRVTKTQAKGVLAAVRKKFAGYCVEGNEPELIYDYQGKGYPAVVWEGGPFEWTYVPLTDTTWDGELAAARDEFPGIDPNIQGVALPAGVWTEAQNHYAIVIYPDE